MMNQDAIRWSAKASETYQRELKHSVDPRSSFKGFDVSVIEKEALVEQCNFHRKINVTDDRISFLILIFANLAPPSPSQPKGGTKSGRH